MKLHAKRVSLICVLLALALLASACSQRMPASSKPEAPSQSAAQESAPEPEALAETTPGEPSDSPAPPALEEQQSEPAEEEPQPQEPQNSAEDQPQPAPEPPPAEQEEAADSAEASPPEESAGKEPSLRAQDKSYAVTDRTVAALALDFGSDAPDFNLTIPATLAVSRPNKAITTTAATYYIMGTSNPGAPLYFDGQEVERLGTKGTWGAYVSLAMGGNSFTVRQGDESIAISITRRGVAGTQPISVITEGSMYPAVQGGVKVGESLKVECVAPSGATVTASFGGRSITLQQAANADSGIPATFRGEIPVDSDYPAGVTTKAGKVSYTLTWGGKTTQYQSKGDVFVAGSGSYIAIRVTAYQGFVYNDPKVPSVFKEKLRTGAADYVYSEDNAYYRLYSGGYIAKEQCEIIEGQVKIGNKISAVTTAFWSGGGEAYSFQGSSTPAYYAYYGEGDTFVLKVYNTNGAQPVDVSSSRLFSSVQANANDNNSVTYIFRFKDPGRYWGYLVKFSGTNLVLSFQYKPTLSGGSQPLAGVKIMLDPGHGGNDSGALGFPGTKGPDENTLNLANAYAARQKLQALGAEVVMTRYQLEEYYTLDQRLQLFEQSGAHMFIALHHNSLAESSDGNKVSGTEIYYHTPHSGTAASRLINSYVAQVGRTNRGAKNGYYRVTLLPQSPSMLLEMGFICSPTEYESLVLPSTIEKSAQGIADGVLAALR